MTTRLRERRGRDVRRRNGAAMAPVASVESQGFCVDVNELSRRVRVRRRGEVAVLDAVSFAVATR